MRRNEHESEDDADDRCAAELLHRRPADERRQEGERRIRQDLAHAHEVVAHLDAEVLQHAAQTHEKTGSDEHGNDRHEDVAERARDLLRRRHLLVCGFLIGAARERGIHADEHVVDLVDEARAENDLVLCSREELPLDAVDVLDRLVLDLILVVQDQPQTRRAVLGGADVRHAADVVENLSRHALLSRHRGVGGIRPCRCCSRRRYSRRCRRCRLACLVLAFARRGDLLCTQRERNRAVVRRIRHDDGRRRIVAGRANRRLVELDEEIALLDLRPLLHMRREVLALKVHRVESDVNEQVDALRRMKADCMLRRKEHRALAVEWRANLALRILDRRAAPHGLTGERRIIDLLEGDKLALQGAFQQ